MSVTLLSVLCEQAEMNRTSIRLSVLFFINVCSGLTKKAEPPPTCDVNRDSGTDSANGGWLRRLVRPHVSHAFCTDGCASKIPTTTPMARKMPSIIAKSRGAISITRADLSVVRQRRRTYQDAAMNANGNSK